MKHIILLLLSICLLKVTAQTTSPAVVNTSGEPVDFYYLMLTTPKDTLLLDSFKKLTQKHKSEFTQLVVSHMSYESYFINDLSKVPDTITLKETKVTLADVEVTAKEKGRFVKGLASTLFRFSSNSTFNDKIATFKEGSNNTIAHLDIYLQNNFEGVKNMAYLPFKVSLYTKDTLTGKPLAPFYTSDILELKENRSYCYILDVSAHHIIPPKEGFFIVFETLPPEYYEPLFIRSRIGTISATPMVKNSYNKKYKNSSYRWNRVSVEDASMHWVATSRKIKLNVSYKK